MAGCLEGVKTLRSAASVLVSGMLPNLELQSVWDVKNSFSVWRFSIHILLHLSGE